MLSRLSLARPGAPSSGLIDGPLNWVRLLKVITVSRFFCWGRDKCLMCSSAWALAVDCVVKIFPAVKIISSLKIVKNRSKHFITKSKCP